MNIEHLDVKNLIPHREPFIMIGQMLECSDCATKTRFLIEDSNIFVENGIFQQVPMLENVAQTCAARLGFFNLNNPTQIGFIGSINDFYFIGENPKVGDYIYTEIIVEAEIANIVLLRATIECNSKIIGKGKMKVVLMGK